MPKATSDDTTTPAPLTSGKTALAMLEIGEQLAKLASIPAGHPDSHIITLCSTHPHVLAAATEHGDMGDENDRYWSAYLASCDAIGAATPQTAEGWLAKAWAAKAEALQHDGSEHPANGPAEEWAWSLVQDMIRLHAAPNPDAALLALCKEFIDLEQSLDSLGANDPEKVVDEDFRGLMEPFDARQRAIAERLAGMPVKTLEGAQAIARAAARWAPDVIKDGFAELGGLHGDLYAALVRGLIGEVRP